MLIFQNVENEVELNPHHEDDPIYSPSLKVFLSMGHFITISISQTSPKIVGRIMQRSIDNPSNVLICIYLPLNHEQTCPIIDNPLIRLCRIAHMSCVNTTELVKTSQVAEVSPANISGLAFVFLGEDVTEYVYHIQGMKDAYVIRYKFSPSCKTLMALSREDFFHFWIYIMSIS